MSNTTTKQLPHEKSEWNGYTLEEIRYMRAYTAARKIGRASCRERVCQYV